MRWWLLREVPRVGDADFTLDRLDGVLAGLIRACKALVEHLAPFLPDAAARVSRQCALSGGRLPEPAPVFPKIAP